MKSIIFKVVLGGLIAFFALPVIFDTEETSRKNLLGVAAYSEEEDFDMLPVIRRSALPNKSENFLSKYAGKIKKFYTGGSKQKATPAGDLYAYVNDTEYNNYVSSANDGDDEIIRDSFIQESEGTPVSGASSYNSSAQKQLMHGNTPVSGLYESSATDSYTARTQAKEVYSKVMRRVDRRNPAASQPLVVTKLPEKAAPTLDIKTLPTGKTGLKRQAAEHNNLSDNSESQYVGIASKNSGGIASSGSSAYSSFGGNQVSASGDSSGNSAQYNSFESQAQGINANVKKVAAPSKRFNVVSGGKVPATPSSQAPGAAKPVVPPVDNNGQGGGHDHGGQGDNTEDPKNPEPDKPVQPKPEEKPNKPFDPDGWTTVVEKLLCDVSGPKDSNPSNNSITEIQKKVLEQPAEKAASEDHITIDSCAAVTLPQISEEVKTKYKFVVELGAAKNGFVMPTNSASAGKIMEGIGADYYKGGRVLPGKEDFVVVGSHQLEKYAKDKNNIIITVQEKPIPGAVTERTIKMKDGEIESYKGLDRIVKAIDSVPEKVKAAEEKALKDAAAKKFKADKEKKESVSSEIKSAVEDIKN